MNVIDFTEIPEANVATGDQDRFELFARDFLEALGFQIIEGPGRGADRGRDLIVAEVVGGAISKQQVLWVVSAKHKAHSGSSVTDRDEPDPIGRVKKFKAQGFMGFYSTLLSSGLDDTLTRLKSEVYVYVFDRGRIENRIIGSPELQTVFQQYFPSSYDKFMARVKSELKPSELSLEASQLLAKVQSGSTPLAQCIAEALALAQKAHDNSFETFCRNELAGWPGLDSIEADADSNYRLAELFLAFGVVINLNSWEWREDPNRIIQYMQEHPDEFKPWKGFMGLPVSELEARQALNTAKGLLVFNYRLKDILPNSKFENPDLPIKGYAHPKVFQTIYDAVRRELTIRLLNMLPKIEETLA